MSITPGRQSELLLDFDETVLVDPAWQLHRQGADIAPSAFSGQSVSPFQSGTKYWASSGAITLAPIQSEVSGISEYNDSYQLVIRASQMTLIQSLAATSAITIIQEQPFWKKASFLSAAAYSSSIANNGDYFLVKRIPAGSDGSPAAPITGAGNPPGTTTVDIPMDRVGLSLESYAANQGFFLRFRVPGVNSAAPKAIFGFLFGQYYVSFGGSGDVTLYEYCNDSNGNSVVRFRDKWKFARPSQISNQTHTFGIWPARGPRAERLIHFVNNALDLSGLPSTLGTNNSQQQTPSDHLYQPDKTNRFGDEDMSPGAVTQAAKFAFDIRRDLKVDLQISVWGWARNGTLIDQPAQLPEFTDLSDNPIYAQMVAFAPDNTSITPSLLDADTGGDVAEGTTRLQSQFVLTGDGTNTPTLWSYQLRRDAGVQVASPGSFTCPVTEVRTIGPSGDMSQETGHVTVKDVMGLYPRLSNRGQLPAKIIVYDPVSNSYIVLFHGYALRPISAQRRAKGKKRGGAGVATTSYPSDNWRNYSIPLVGQWQRLQEVDYLGQEGARYRIYCNNQTSPYEFPDQSTQNTINETDGQTPWLVLDAIRDLLYQTGYTPSQVNFPSCAVRLWAGQTDKAMENMVSPTTNLAEMISRWCANYLGATMIWDGNSGDNGQWRIIWPPTPLAIGDTNTYASLWNFVTTGRQYIGDGTALILGMPNYSVVPPEYNAVRVLTHEIGSSGDLKAKYDRYLFNPASFPFRGFSTQPDPNSPNYIGRLRLYTIIDTTLVDNSDPVLSQFAVDWTAKRFFNVGCFAQRTVGFTAPLIFCTDPYTGRLRPLRHYDPISIDGDNSWVVKCVSPSYNRDSIQLAEYECIQPFAKQVFHGGVDGIDFYRKTQKRMALRSTGHATGSHLWANMSVTPGAEQRILSLPSTDYARGPLQNPDGSLIDLPGFDVQNNAPG